MNIHMEKRVSVSRQRERKHDYINNLHHVFEQTRTVDAH